MKLVGKSLARDGPGSVKLLPEVDDDLWDAYNLIAAGDADEPWRYAPLLLGSMLRTPLASSCSTQ